jgi:hypothetical protein
VLFKSKKPPLGSWGRFFYVLCYNAQKHKGAQQTMNAQADEIWAILKASLSNISINMIKR